MLVLDVCARTCAEERGCAVPRAWPGYGWRCWRAAVRCPASAASEPPTVDGRPARGAVVRRVAQRLPTALRPPAKHSRRARRGPRPATRADDAPAARAPPPARRRPRPGPRGVPETVFLQKWSRVLFVLGGITGPRTLQQVFSARASVSARARLRSAVSSVSHSISLPSRVRICRAAMLIFAGARPTHGR